MTDIYRIWTHGVNVVPEYTSEYTGSDNELYLKREGYGAKIRQKGDSDNWFHFPISTPEWVNDSPVEIYHAYIRGEINNLAKIKKVRAHGSMGGSDSPIIFRDDDLNLTGCELNEKFSIRDAVCRGPFVICVNVYFKRQGGGEILFTSAGVEIKRPLHYVVSED